MPKIVHRKMQFKFTEGFQKHWHGGSPFVSFFYNALSAAFPAGESFFCDTIKHYKNQIDDPELRDDIDQFVKQELHHVYQHKLFNNMLAAQGFDIKKAEKRNADFLSYVRKNYTPEEQLAFTMAFEHFTAALADQILTNPKLFGEADPKVASLWLWHAAEETEHKSVAFDVYKAIGGSYKSRVRVYMLAFYKLFSIAFMNQYDMLKVDGAFNKKDILLGCRYLLGKGGLMRGVFRELATYLKASFRPWDLNNAHLIDNWQEGHKSEIESFHDATKSAG